jgi:hypothetical protein
MPRESTSRTQRGKRRVAIALASGMATIVVCFIVWSTLARGDELRPAISPSSPDDRRETVAEQALRSAEPIRERPAMARARGAPVDWPGDLRESTADLAEHFCLFPRLIAATDLMRHVRLNPADRAIPPDSRAELTRLVDAHRARIESVWSGREEAVAAEMVRLVQRGIAQPSRDHPLASTEELQRNADVLAAVAAKRGVQTSPSDVLSRMLAQKRPTAGIRYLGSDRGVFLHADLAKLPEIVRIHELIDGMAVQFLAEVTLWFQLYGYTDHAHVLPVLAKARQLVASRRRGP